MHPQIEFRHVLGELSVNRNDPCEVIRELISNSYDAGASIIYYAPLDGKSGFAFLDDGSGLGFDVASAGISPWEAFFSIGKSTKAKGAAIGYKCQGSKLCFASKRILVATRFSKFDERWAFKVVENPRNNLDVNYSIAPDYCDDVSSIIDGFLGTLDANGVAVVGDLKSRLGLLTGKTGTLVLIDGLDTENFGKYFSVEPVITESYVYNYVRFNTRHGDVRMISTAQGFSSSQVAQIQNPPAAQLTVFSPTQGPVDVPFGFPYLSKPDGKDEVKSPQQISRLRDGRFCSRTAKSFSVAGKKYSAILAIDGNRRAHEEYPALDRKGKARSGVRLGDHRGAFISVKGIKIAKHAELLSNIPEYSVLAEGDAYSHYMLVIEGDFDLVTNRNALSKQAYDELSDPEFAKKFKEFLDSFRGKDAVFSELIARLRRESSENLLNEQIDILTEQKAGLKDRQRVRVSDQSGVRHLVLAPKAGEEYLVGVLYAALGKYVPASSAYRNYWRDVVTFSTQGIDSLALRDAAAAAPLAEKNVEAIEYKYEFSNHGPFNHALAVVDKVVAWSVELDPTRPVRDTYTCQGSVRELVAGLIWEITDIENDEAAEFPDATTVICLRKLIELTFGVNF
ncbi:MAG: hypothetical protein U1F26_09775 [Lysobacterales bacterium]